MSLDEALKISQIAGPVMTAALGAIAATYAARQKDIAEQLKLIRERQHAQAKELQTLPTNLRPWFVSTDTFTEHTGAMDRVHDSLDRRIAAVEARTNGR